MGRGGGGGMGEIERDEQQQTLRRRFEKSRINPK